MDLTSLFFRFCASEDSEMHAKSQTTTTTTTITANNDSNNTESNTSTGRSHAADTPNSGRPSLRIVIVAGN